MSGINVTCAIYWNLLNASSFLKSYSVEKTCFFVMQAFNYPETTIFVVSG